MYVCIYIYIYTHTHIVAPLPCTEGPLNSQGDGRDAFNGKTSQWRRRRQHWLAATAPGWGAHGEGGHRGLRGN